MSDDGVLQAPKDAAIVNKASKGRAKTLYTAAKRSEADMMDVTTVIHEWEAGGFLGKILGLPGYVKARLAVTKITDRHHQNFIAYNRLVAEVRQSAAYAERVAADCADQERPTPPDASATEAPPLAIPDAPAPETGQSIVEPSPPAPIASGTDQSAEPVMSERREVHEPMTIFGLTVNPRGAPVESLFRPRRRRGEPVPPPDIRGSDRIYLPVAPREIEAVTSLGAVVGPKGGVFVPTGVDLEPLEEWLPFYARRVIEPLNVDLIPASNWGGSLANLLLNSCWENIRQGVVCQTGDKCIICGLDSRGKSVDCHEIWEYYRPVSGDIGVQRLVDIIPVCRQCHEMFHLGLANQNGRLEDAFRRLAWANRWSFEDVLKYWDYTGEKWLRRNNFAWVLDLSLLSSETLILKGGQTGVQIDEDGDLHYRSRLGEGSTRFVGVSFGHARQEPYPPRPPVDYAMFVKDV